MAEVEAEVEVEVKAEVEVELDVEVIEVEVEVEADGPRSNRPGLHSESAPSSLLPPLSRLLYDASAIRPEARRCCPCPEPGSSPPRSPPRSTSPGLPTVEEGRPPPRSC
mmetsp:Transcript_18067/g.36403  ORF Transcript_18067/g.36403 Transcript_18067/m.36403 type:complete len:109 (+) Transcript_18067:604-930(+)